MGTPVVAVLGTGNEACHCLAGQTNVFERPKKRSLFGHLGDAVYLAPHVAGVARRLGDNLRSGALSKLQAKFLNTAVAALVRGCVGLLGSTVGVDVPEEIAFQEAKVIFSYYVFSLFLNPRFS